MQHIESLERVAPSGDQFINIKIGGKKNNSPTSRVQHCPACRRRQPTGCWYTGGRKQSRCGPSPLWPLCPQLSSCSSGLSGSCIETVVNALTYGSTMCSQRRRSYIWRSRKNQNREKKVLLFQIKIHFSFFGVTLWKEKSSTDPGAKQISIIQQICRQHINSRHIQNNLYLWKL